MDCIDQMLKSRHREERVSSCSSHLARHRSRRQRSGCGSNFYAAVRQNHCDIIDAIDLAGRSVARGVASEVARTESQRKRESEISTAAEWESWWWKRGSVAASEGWDRGKRKAVWRLGTFVIVPADVGEGGSETAGEKAEIRREGSPAAACHSRKGRIWKWQWRWVGEGFCA